jgi:pimeloyl-ACP methyl ester carboxylesterase
MAPVRPAFPDRAGPRPVKRAESIMFPERLNLQIAGALGHPLAARLDRPAGPPRAYALFAHCFTCGKDLKAATWISRELVDQRIAVLRFDFTGLGASGGDFADTNLTSNIADLLAAADHLRTNFAAPQILVGHSLGGAAVLLAAPQIPECRAVATIAAPSQTTHLHALLAAQTPALAADEDAPVRVLNNTVRIKGQLLDDLQQHDVLAALARLDRPLLIFHSPVDEIVSIEEAGRIFRAARHPKSFIALDGADHLLVQREADARFVARMLACWAGRYIEESARR